MIKITLNTIEKPYKNIQLEIFSNKEILIEYCDLYYFCLDSLFLKEETDFIKGLLNFIYLLNNWKSKLKNIDNEVFLPFDFSDEYIGGLLLQRFSNDILKCAYVVSREFKGPLCSPTQISIINPNIDKLIFLSLGFKFKIKLSNSPFGKYVICLLT
jgi:hypothetical protein